MVDISPPVDVSSAVDISAAADVSAPVDVSAPQQKGFFETLRNPIDLMYNESVIRQGYNYLTGDTQEVQAKRAKDFIEANPGLMNTPEYKNAQAKLERYGYLLEENQIPFTFAALQEAVRTNPGQMAGEFVNAFMADPYLIFTPYLLGGNALTKLYQSNKILGKVPRIARGAAIGTAAVPEAALYSVIQQAGEGGEFDANRMAVETAIGGAGGLGLGIAFGGSFNTIGKVTNTIDETKAATLAKFKLAERGDETALKELAMEFAPEGAPKLFSKQTIETIERVSGDEFKFTNKNQQRMYNAIMTDVNEMFKTLSVDMSDISLRKKIYRNSVTPVVAGTMFGAGGALATGEPENFAVVGGSVLAGLTFGKVATKAFVRASDARKGKDFINSKATEDDFTGWINELKETGVDLDKINVKKNFVHYKNAADNLKTFNKDLADLGQAKGLLDQKTTLMTRYILDDMEIFSRLGGMYSHRLNMAFRKEHPIKTKERKLAVLNYIQKARFKDGDNKGKIIVKEKDLSPEELNAAKAAQDYFEQMHKALSDSEDLLLAWRKNFLPGFWQRSSMIGDEDAKSILANFFTESAKGTEYKGKLATENLKKINSYQEGIDLGLEPRSLDLGDIIALYNNSLYKALAERTAVNRFFKSNIPGRTSKKGKPQKYMYTKESFPKDDSVDASDYLPFRDSAFEEHSPRNLKRLKEINRIIANTNRDKILRFKNINEQLRYKNKLIDESYKSGLLEEVLVYKEAAPHLKMVFDGTKEKGFFRAVSNINFLQKRMSVGYSFFHGAALFENMIFAGVGAAKIATVAGLDKVPGIRYIIPKTVSAKRRIIEGGHGDDYEAGLRAGVIFSHPEDIGYHRFYDLFQGANRIADRIGSPLLGWTMKQGIDKLVVKPFKFIDAVTWDHVYNSGKLFTFQTKRNKLLLDPANKDVPLAIINRRAAEFTNDAYGGLNWRQIYEDTTNPLLKKLTSKAFTPSGRRALQLLLFAPDWTTANIRIINKAFPGFNKDPISRKLYQAYAMRAALIYATFGSALQYMFTGKSLLENKDPTKIDLGNGDTMVFSKQLMEPLHWAVHPYKTLVSKQGSTLKLTEQLLFNKKFLTSPFPSPISEEDLFSLYRARDYGQQIGESFIPFSFRTPIQQMMKDGVHFQDAINYLLGNFGHPVYPEGRRTKYYTGFN